MLNSRVIDYIVYEGSNEEVKVIKPTLDKEALGVMMMLLLFLSCLHSYLFIIQIVCTKSKDWNFFTLRCLFILFFYTILFTPFLFQGLQSKASIENFMFQPPSLTSSLLLMFLLHSALHRPIQQILLSPHNLLRLFILNMHNWKGTQQVCNLDKDSSRIEVL